MRMTSLITLSLLTACVSAGKNGDAHLTYAEFREFQKAVWKSDLPCNRSRILRLKACPLNDQAQTDEKCVAGFLDPKEGHGQLYFRAVFSSTPERHVQSLSL